MSDREAGRLSSFESGAGGVRPNVVLITLDACRYDLLVENLERLPNLKALAERSSFFENAFSAGPLTFFACPAMIAGIYPYHWGTGIHRPVKGIDEILKDAGYHTGVMIEANPFLSRRFGYGLGADVWLTKDGLAERTVAQGFRNIQEPAAGKKPEAWAWRRFESPYLLARIIRELRPLWERNQAVKGVGSYVVGVSEFVRRYPLGRGPDIEKARDGHSRFCKHVLDFIKDRFREPQFLWVHTMVSHLPYLTPPNNSAFTNRRTNYLNCRGVSNFVNRGICRELKRLYVESLTLSDNLVGEVMAALSSKNLLDSSIIILSSDHGEEFMEEGTYSHTLASSDILLHVPLMVSYGDRLQPRRIAAPVSTVDIPPTVCDLLGIGMSGGFRGTSLKPVLCEPGVETAASARSWSRPLFSEAWALNTNLDRRPGHESHRRIFTVRKNRYKLKLTELQWGEGTIEEKLELMDWVSGRRLDLNGHKDVVEELRHLVTRHVYEEGVMARELRRKTEQQHVRDTLSRVLKRRPESKCAP